MPCKSRDVIRRSFGRARWSADRMRCQFGVRSSTIGKRSSGKVVPLHVSATVRDRRVISAQDHRDVRF